MANSTLRLGFFHGISSVSRAAKILWHSPRVILWLIPPLLITLLLDAAAFYFAFEWLRSTLAGRIPGAGWWASLRTTLDFLGAVVIIAGLGWSFTGLFLVLASPFQDFISAAVEREVRGVATPDPIGISGLLRSIFQSLVQAAVLAIFTLFFLLLALIPMVGAVIFFVWTAFALGYSFVSIHSGRTGQPFAARRTFAMRHIGAVLGLGALIAGASFIPLFNVLLMPCFVVAGTLLHIDAEFPPPQLPA